jgi:glycosyltransferase involved in cell wall biosynthesis
MNVIVNSRFLTQKITGVQRFGIEVSRRLANLSGNFTFVSPHNVLHNKIAEELNVVCYGRLRGHFWEQIELPRFLKSRRENWLLLNLGNTGSLRYGNQITTIHDLGFLHNPAWYSKRFYMFYKFLIPRVINSSRIVITVSEFSKSELIIKLNVAEEKIKIAHNGVSPVFLKSAKERKKVGDSRFILMVSSIDPRKNMEGAIAAFGKLEDKSIRLVIAGEKNRIFADSKIGNSLLESGRIRIIGVRDDESIRSLYTGAELIIFPSFYEGFGLPPLEAMACGCPCVVSNIASLSEVCGDAALYCDPYNIDDIAEKMNLILADTILRDGLIDRGYERAKGFTWDKTAENILNYIKEEMEL